MNQNLTLGSLFDGSGGFPLGGLIFGITLRAPSTVFGAMGLRYPACTLFCRALCMPTGLPANLDDIVLRIRYVLFIVDAEDMILSEPIAHMSCPTQEADCAIRTQ